MSTPSAKTDIVSFRDAPVRLRISLWRRREHVSSGRGWDPALVGTDPDGEGTWQPLVEDVEGRTSFINATTCRRHGHYPVSEKWDPTINLDCPCDVGCPRCKEPTGMQCSTPTGYAATWHRQRVDASPRVQAIRSGERTRCDVGDHRWTAVEPYLTATCGGCGRTEPVDPEAKRYYGFGPKP